MIVIGYGLNGRVLTRYPAKLELSYQDEGRTLKVFLTGEHPTARAENAKALASSLAHCRKCGDFLGHGHVCKPVG